MRTLRRLFLDIRFSWGVSFKFYNTNSDRALAVEPSNIRRTKEKLNSHWVKITDTGLRNANGQSLRETLINILDEFPNYELQSEEGCEAAIHDMESKIT